jgi:hypothetical protein
VPLEIKSAEKIPSPNPRFCVDKWASAKTSVSLNEDAGMKPSRFVKLGGRAVTAMMRVSHFFYCIESAIKARMAAYRPIQRLIENFRRLLQRRNVPEVQLGQTAPFYLLFKKIGKLGLRQAFAVFESQFHHHQRCGKLKSKKFSETIFPSPRCLTRY